MTIYKELVEDKVHKSFLTKNWDRLQVYEGGTQLLEVQAFAFLSSHQSFCKKKAELLPKKKSHSLLNTNSLL